MFSSAKDMRIWHAKRFAAVAMGLVWLCGFIVLCIFTEPGADTRFAYSPLWVTWLVRTTFVAQIGVLFFARIGLYRSGGGVVCSKCRMALGYAFLFALVFAMSELGDRNAIWTGGTILFAGILWGQHACFWLTACPAYYHLP